MRAAPLGCRRATCERGRAVRARAEAQSTGKAGRTLKVQKLSNESFAAFGQVPSAEYPRAPISRGRTPVWPHGRTRCAARGSERTGGASHCMSVLYARPH